jgi:uncharacterized protein
MTILADENGFSLRRLIVRALRVLVIVAVIVVVYMRFFEHSFIYYPSREMVAEPLGQFEDVFFEALDGTRLHGWWFPKNDAANALIVSHGNAGNISRRISMAEFLRNDLGVNVFYYDYRGYGRSEGEPSEAGTYSDAHGAYRHVRGRGFAPDSILLLGQSLGTAITVELAVSEKVAGVILEAPFTSVTAVASRFFWRLPIGLLMKTKYDSLAKISRLRVPIAIIHATEDPVIDYSFGRELFEAANPPKEFFEVRGEFHEGAIKGLGHDALQHLKTFLGINLR